MVPENKNQNTLRYIALFPHEDVARELRKVQGELFKAGVAGARFLPPCIILSAQKEGVSRQELENLGDMVGQFRQEQQGFFIVDKPGLSEAPLTLPCWGLSTTLPQSLANTGGTAYLVLAVLRPGDPPPALPPTLILPLRFRPAYLANLAMRLDSFGCEWEQGRPTWLTQR